MSLSNLSIPEIKKELKPLGEIHWIKRTIDQQERFKDLECELNVRKLFKF